MNAAQYATLKARVIACGFADEIQWSTDIQPVASPVAFATEHAFVVCNSGMKAQIARPIFEKVRHALERGRSAALVFHHPGKARAIDDVWNRRYDLYETWLALRTATLREQLDWLRTLPYIGGITVYHLAKNYGVDCCKPDRHLVRIAAASGEMPHALCARLADATGDRIATVDSVIWRAANMEMI